MNSAMFLVVALALCMLPSALSLKCYHCMGSLANLKLCTNMSEYAEQTCMSDNATCGMTELKSNRSEVKAFVLGCVEEPHNCSSYQMSLCANATMEVKAANASLEMCETQCCNGSLCNKVMLPTTASTVASATGTGTVEATTATAQVFRPELMGMLIALMAVFFGLQ